MSVILRKRKVSSGRTQLYLDICPMGNRKTEALVRFARIKTALHRAVRDNPIPVNPAKATIRRKETLPIYLSMKEFCRTKTDNRQRLSLSAQALRILMKQKRAAPSLKLEREIPANSVFFLPPQPVVDKQLKKWATDAGPDKPLSFHKARDSFATVALSSGVDLCTVSKLLGHKNFATTRIYARVVDEKKRLAGNGFPSL